MLRMVESRGRPLPGAEKSRRLSGKYPSDI